MINHDPGDHPPTVFQFLSLHAYLRAYLAWRKRVIPRTKAHAWINRYRNRAKANNEKVSGQGTLLKYFEGQPADRFPPKPDNRSARSLRELIQMDGVSLQDQPEIDWFNELIQIAKISNRMERQRLTETLAQDPRSEFTHPLDHVEAGVLSSWLAPTLWALSTEAPWAVSEATEPLPEGLLQRLRRRLRHPGQTHIEQIRAIVRELISRKLWGISPGSLSTESSTDLPDISHYKQEMLARAREVVKNNRRTASGEAEFALQDALLTIPSSRLPLLREELHKVLVSFALRGNDDSQWPRATDEKEVFYLSMMLMPLTTSEPPAEE